MLRTSGSARRDRTAKAPSHHITWYRLAIVALIAGAAAGAAYSCFQGAAAPFASGVQPGVFAGPGPLTVPGLGQNGGYILLPSGHHRHHRHHRHCLQGGAVQASAAPQPTASPAARLAAEPAPGAIRPLAGGGYAGPLVLNATGSRLMSWNRTSALCPQHPFQGANGRVGTDSSGNATLTVNGLGSCAALVSPGCYASAVIEAEIDFPALPGHPGTIANWTAFWLTDDHAWPEDGELDAAEAEPVDGVNAVSWHSGTSAAQFVASTDGLSPYKLPVSAPNLTPGWHTVDVVYTKGFFAVYYDGTKYTSYTSGYVTGDPLNIYVTTTVTPDVSAVRQRIGGPPVNSDGSPATVAVKYLRVWSYR
jgi:hypothetical protein